MALERIDPFQREDRFCLDHILRYVWAQPLVVDKRVLDVACGLGFGVPILHKGIFTEVVGLDRDEAVIDRCKSLWTYPRVEFRAGALEDLPGMGLKPFDRIVSFETLEHVADPALALRALRAVLAEGGVLVGSVPGELDGLEDNAYHRHFFRPDQLEELLRAEFSEVRVFRQAYFLASVIEPAAPPAPGGSVLSRDAREGVRLDFGRAPAWADTWLFVASNAPLPELPAPAHALSRQAWLDAFMEAGKAARELQRLSGEYRELFFRNSDLKLAFSNILAWGQYYHGQATGQPLDVHYLKTIEEAQSVREKELRAEADFLLTELETLRARLREFDAAEAAASEKRRQTFLADLKKLPPAAKDPLP